MRVCVTSTVRALRVLAINSVTRVGLRLLLFRVHARENPCMNLLQNTYSNPHEPGKLLTVSPYTHELHGPCSDRSPTPMLRPIYIRSPVPLYLMFSMAWISLNIYIMFVYTYIDVF